MRYLKGILIAAAALAILSGCNDSRVLKKITVSEVNLSTVTNGTYRGNYSLHLPAGTFIGQPSAVVDVSVKDNRYHSIQLVNIPVWMITNKGMEINRMLDQILLEQKLNVDSTSGASYTKKAIQKAIENAFSNNLIQ